MKDIWPCKHKLHRVSSNRELERPGIVTEIKSRRTERLGHILRMESSRVPQEILSGRPEGKRSIG
jgi:hypothetical protein